MSNFTFLSVRLRELLDLVSALVQKLGFERTFRKFLLLESQSHLFDFLSYLSCVCVCVSKLGSDATE